MGLITSMRAIVVCMYVERDRLFLVGAKTSTYVCASRTQSADPLTLGYFKKSLPHWVAYTHTRHHNNQSPPIV